MTDAASEKEKLVQAILRRHHQPRLEDAVEVIQFSKIKSVAALLELHDELRKAWWDRLHDGTWE